MSGNKLLVSLYSYRLYIDIYLIILNRGQGRSQDSLLQGVGLDFSEQNHYKNETRMKCYISSSKSSNKHTT